MKLVVVGCSGSGPGPDSAASAYLVSATRAGRTTTVLLDLGSGAFGPLMGLIDPRTIDAIVLSHLHPDHCLDMCAWHVAAQHSASAPWDPVDVYAPAGAAERVARAHDVGQPDPASLASSFRFHDLAEGEAVQIGALAMTVARMAHPVETYAVRLEEHSPVDPAAPEPAQADPTVSLVYSGDTGPTQALVELARDAQLLLAEASFAHRDDLPPALHLSGVQAGEIAEAAGVETLVLTHVPAWEDAEARADEASGVFDGRIIVAQPGLTLRSKDPARRPGTGTYAGGHDR